MTDEKMSRARRGWRLLKSGRPSEVTRAARRGLTRSRYRLFDRAFELRFRIASNGWVHSDEVTIKTPHTQWGPTRETKLRSTLTAEGGPWIYSPTPVLALHQSFKLLPADVRGWTFVDYGSGKGRVLVFAGRYPFQRVIGLEFADELHEQAVRNVAAARRWLRCQYVEAAHLDVLDFEPPAEPCVFFFSNPFRREVMEAVLQRIRASLHDWPRPAVLMAHGNCPVDLFDGLEGFRLIGSKPALEGMHPDPAIASFRVYANDRVSPRPTGRAGRSPARLHR